MILGIKLIIETLNLLQEDNYQGSHEIKTYFKTFIAKEPIHFDKHQFMISHTQGSYYLIHPYLSFDLFCKAMSMCEIKDRIKSMLDLEFPLTVNHYIRLLKATLLGLTPSKINIYQSDDLLKINCNTNSLCCFIEKIFITHNSTNVLGNWG